MATPSASPQTENGYTMIANELFDALIRFRIPGEQRQVIDFIIRKTYGFRKKVDAIPLIQFVKATGIKKSHVIRAINVLKLRNMISGAKTGTFDATIYGINKDYRSWRKPPRKVPKKGLVPKKATKVPKRGPIKVPKRGHSKENTKETNQKKKDISAFPQKAGEKAGPPEPFYLTKKKKKLKGWKLETFELFWKTFNWKKDKANASDAWLQIPNLTKELAIKQIIPAAARYCVSRPAIIANRDTPKWAQGWLSSRRWEDEKFEDEKDGLDDFLRRHGKT